MTSTNRILCAMSFLAFFACGADKVVGTGGIGGAGAAGMAGGGGHGGGGTGTAGASGEGGGGAGGRGGQTGCVFSATYTIIDGAGVAEFEKRTTLSPPATFQFDRMVVPHGATTTCTPDLPACGSAKIDVADVEAAMANADVVAAFAAATEPFYGERNVADGPSFEVIRSTGGKLMVGLECTTASATCVPTPAGVHALVQLLRDLIAQQTADPGC